MPNNVLTPAERYLSQPIEATKLAAKRFVEVALRNYIGLLLIGFIAAGLFIAVIMLAAYLSYTSNNSFPTGWLIFASVLLLLPVAIILSIASDYMFVKSQNLEVVTTKSALKRGGSRFWVAVGTYILNGLVVLGGLLLLIVPGIYFALRQSYVNSIVANEDLGPVDSIKRSWQLTKGNLWDIVGASSVVMIAISLLSLAAYGLLEVIGQVNFIWASDVAIGLLTLPLAAVLYFRYHQSALEKSGKLVKDETNSLNYLLLIPAVLSMMAFGAYAAHLEGPLEEGDSDSLEEFFQANTSTRG